MRKGLALLLGSMLFSTAALAHCCNCCCSCGDQAMMKKEKMMKKKQMRQQRMMQQDAKPSKIDKNNVSDTSGEAPDQTDPTLIEGNLENNDFKN